MGLRIVSGKSRGRKLKGPKKGNIRPAAARVRKSLFEILGDLSGLKVLDLFAGTGSMGLEAFSKGADEVTFVDHDDQAVKLLLHNLGEAGYLDQAYILKKKALAAITWLQKKRCQYDLIFLDPPYDEGHVDQCLKKLSQWDLLTEDGLLLCEHSPREIPAFYGRLHKEDERKYGQTLVTFLRK